MRNIVGPPVQGDDFFGRERDVVRLGREVRDQHVLLLAPRRVGKTSLLHALASLSRETFGSHAAYASMAKVDSELGFVKALCREVCKIPEAAPLKRHVQTRRAGRVLGRIATLKTPVFELSLKDWPEDAWQTIGEDILARLAKLPGRWLLLIDELPLFILKLIKLDPTAERARTFLHWFRDVRQTRPGGRDNVHWLLAGSIGLDALARRYRFSDTINDLHCEPLGPFDASTARLFLSELARSHRMELPAAARERMCDLAEWLIPYHLQLLFKTLRGYCGDGRLPPSVAAAEQAFEILLSPTRRNAFDWWDQRLTEELGAPRDAWIRDLLTAAARDPRGADTATLSQILARHIAEPNDRAAELHWLLDVMENDGYVIRAEGRHRFRSNLLRRYWIERLA